MVACHATVRGPHFFGADGFDKFIEVHTLSHPVAQMIQLTGMIFEGVPEKYPQPSDRVHGSRLLLAAVLDGPHGRGVGEAQGRGAPVPKEAERLPASPDSSSSRPKATRNRYRKSIRRLGNDIVFYASDVPHWDHDYPDNIRELATREDLSAESKRKILYENTRRLYEPSPGASLRSGR